MTETNPAPIVTRPKDGLVQFISIVLMLAAALIAYLITPFLVRHGVLPMQAADTQPHPHNSQLIQMAISLASLVLSLLFILRLPRRLQKETETYFSRRTQWRDIVRWRELWTAVIAAMFALLFSAAQSQPVIEAQYSWVAFVIIALYIFVILMLVLFNLKPEDLERGQDYRRVLFLAVVVPYIFAAIFSVLPMAVSASSTPCPGITITPPTKTTGWLPDGNANQKIKGTYNSEGSGLNGKLHVFAVSLAQRESWYRWPVNFVGPNTWETNGLPVGPGDTIEFKIVEVDPDSIMGALLSYIYRGPDGIPSTGDEPPDHAYSSEISASDLPVCGEVTVEGINVPATPQSTPQS